MLKERNIEDDEIKEEIIAVGKTVRAYNQINQVLPPTLCVSLLNLG